MVRVISTHDLGVDCYDREADGFSYVDLPPHYGTHSAHSISSGKKKAKLLAELPKLIAPPSKPVSFLNPMKDS